MTDPTPLYNRDEWNALTDEERTAYADPDRPCFTKGCAEPAGTPWGPYWCWRHDAERLERVGSGLRSILAEFEEVEGRGSDD